MKERIKAVFKEAFAENVPTKKKFFYYVCFMSPLFSLLATITNLITGTVTGDNSSLGFWACVICTVCCLCLYPLSKLIKNVDILIYMSAFALNILVMPLLYFTVGGIDSSMPIYFVVGIVFSALMIEDRKTAVAVLTTSFFWYAIVLYYDYHYDIASRFSVLDRPSQFLDTYLDFVVVSSCIAVLVKILATSFENQQVRSDKLLVQMEDLSVKDPLTGAYNRRFLIKYLDDSMRTAAENGTGIAIVMFDIDKFKRINDDYGHLVGDEVIKAVANLLMSSCRDYDIVSRYGGEEFILVMPGASEEIAFNRAEQIRTRFETMKVSSSIDRPVTLSGGVAEFVPSMTSPDDFIKIADDNLYMAKETGRNKTVSLSHNHDSKE
ncbi:MAG: GGDEF domain-containing protein [Clostridia bacterium]|nr:GGDEF domain-containing protein [Clostridia bacterium]MBR5976351.1 GGDEF domain-containing protein [Clostridia bacterium]MBR6512959.1 GGDEF domain-containing protein [Clostridia bacterium]